MNIKISIIGFISMLFLLSSCEEWLDVKPKSEARSEDLFETPDGYRTALNGIYIKLGTSALYGKNLSWGFTDALCQYIYTNSSTYKKVKDFDYEDANVKSLISNIWESEYNAIANCNNLLRNLEETDTTFFESKERCLIQGELYALRGMLHFDLLRLFAPSLKVGDNSSIPYYFKYRNTSAKIHNTSESIDLAIEDIKKGRDLLQKIDTTTNMMEDFKNVEYRFAKSRSMNNFHNRGYRMNYYAASAMLARMYMYKGDIKEAYKYAKEIIDCELFEFTSESDITSNVDTRNRKLSDDIIFAIYNKNLAKNYMDANSFNSNYSLYYPDYYMFADDKDDFRFTYLIEKDDNWNQHSLKMLPVENEDSKLAYEPIIPMIRMSEMYYIVCEYLFDIDKDEAIDMFDFLRLKRGCKKSTEKTITKENFINQLLLDARKEFLCEGQLWFMYKRLNHFIYSESNDKLVIKDEFTLPIPESETNIGDIN